MICPRCSVSEISPLTGTCELCGYALGATVAVERADATSDLATRQLAHEFDFVDLLGRGKDSVVYRALERSSGRSLILKVLPRRTDEPDAEESFRTMLSAFAGFDHPHLVPVLRYGSTDSLFWYAMRDFNSTPLSVLLREQGPMDPRACRRITTQVVAALEYLHRHGVVHGAIKPENVLIDKDGWVRISDPSFARPRWKRHSRPAPVRGNAAIVDAPPPAARPPWVAPEDHARGERLPTADQFAVAALVFECIAGHPPGDPPGHLSSTVAKVPDPMSRAVARSLDADPWRRFPSCADFLWALEEGGTSAPSGRPTDRITQDVVMIKDWEAPDDPRRPIIIAGKVLAALVIGVALWASVPGIMRVIRPPAPASASTPLSSVGPTSTSMSALPAPASIPSPAPSLAAGVSGERQATNVPSLTSGRPRTRPIPPSSIPGAPARVPLPAPSEAPARLFVNATPWGQLYIDGTLIGNTPKTNLELTPGTHVVRVMRAGFTTVERSLRAQSGETIRITDIVLVPTPP